jgi:DNA-binding SARP family transcriptional activator
MDHLHIFLFGSVQVLDQTRLTEVKLTRATQALLAYLILFRARTHSREVLSELFWSQHSLERGRGCLNTAVWRLRSVLESKGHPRGTYLLTTQGGELGFQHASPYWLDVEVFEDQVRRTLAKPIQALTRPDLQEFESALQLYRGELLDGHYFDWALRERERLRVQYLNSQVYLMSYYYMHKDYPNSLVCGQRILNLDPLREEIHRQVMQLYRECGQRAMAISQYEICRIGLAKELGIQPMAETQILYAKILSEPTTSPLFEVGREATDLQRAKHQLREAKQALEQAQAQVLQALQLIERHTARQESSPS